MGLLRMQKTPQGQGHQPGLSRVTLSEAFVETASDAAALGFVLARLPRGQRPVLWVQDRLSRKVTGYPCLAGIGTMRPLIMVNLSRAADVLCALEDGLRCRSLGGVIGEIWGDPAVLDFTATKRLALRSEAAGVPCWLIRRAAHPNLSAARDRWRIAALPSAPHPYDPQSPGAPRCVVELFRSRDAKPGVWVATHDRAADRVDLVAAVSDGTLDAGDGTAGQRAAR
jgi:protein ImuA